MPAQAPAPPAARRLCKKAPLTYLKPGYRLGSPIQDDEGRLLVGAGVTIDEDLLGRLRARGVAWVSIDKRDFEALEALQGGLPTVDELTFDDVADARTEHTPATRQLDEAIAAGEPFKVVASDDPFSGKLTDRGATAYDRGQVAKSAKQLQTTADEVENLIARLDRAENVSGDQLQSLSHEAVVQAAEDMDLFVSLGISATERETIFQHSSSASRLAIALGVRLGLDERRLAELGAGCLVHDAGMLRVDPTLRNAPRKLTTSEFVEIARHPIIGADMLYKNMERVPVSVRMIVYQTHERCDGSGYPRGCTGEGIHALAKIAAVADAYVAKVSARPHRPAIKPYAAIKMILEETNRGRFDPDVVRALLEAVSLFPIGSLVQLEDGRVGRVLRSGGSRFDRPVVEAWRLAAGPQTPEVVDLAAQNLKVSRALGSLREATVPK
ncbi:MAG: HD-GYP domain-containing protein [Planctomycetota bacterium]